MCKDLVNSYSLRVPLLEHASKRLHQEVLLSLRECNHIDRVSFRVKGADSFAKKASDRRNNPPYTDPLREIEDQIAGRVIVFFRSDLKIVHDLLFNRVFQPVEAQERRPDTDAEFGYESNHYVFQIPPQALPSEWPDDGQMPTTFELQLRTLFMHAWAEPQHDIGYKGGEHIPKDIRRELAWIAASAWGADQAYERIIQWTEQQN